MATTTTNWKFKKPESTDLVSPTPFNENFDIIDKLLYPVGSIYLSVNNVSPSNLFGGTWVQIKDRFLLACGDIYANGATGGEASHTLTIEEMPAHNHSASTNYTGEHSHSYTHAAYAGSDRFTNHTGAEIGYGGANTSSAGNHSHTVSVGNTGSGKAHNNMPPYLAVYMWQRTA